MKKSKKIILCMLPMLAMFSCSSKKPQSTKDVMIHSQTGDSDTITSRYNRGYGYHYPFWLWHNRNYIRHSEYRNGRFISPSLFTTPHTTSFQRGGFGKTGVTRGGFHS